MSKQYSVTAAFAKVSIGSPSGNRVAVLLRRGDFVPDGVSDEQLERLSDRSLIAEVEADEDEGKYKGVSAKDVKAELASRNEGRADADKVVPAEPGNRAEIVAALLADDAK